MNIDRMHRLFVAIDLPDTHAAVLDALRDETLPGARWTRPGRHHLTLRFIGDADDERMRDVVTALEGVTSQRFSLSVVGTGVFPSAGRPRVLVVHLLPEPKLAELQDAVEESLRRAGVEPEERPFKAHVTLARFKETDPQAVRAYLDRHAGLSLPPFQAAEFHLYESTLTRSGSIYTRICSYPLA